MNNEKLYCGDKTPIPEGYKDYDTRYNCLKKGIGVGLNKKKKRIFNIKWGHISIIVIIILLIVIFLLILFLYLR